MVARAFTDEQEHTVRLRYEGGESSESIAADLGCSFYTILRAVKRAGGTAKPACKPTIYQCDHHYFDRIDSEPKAYWLGFITADGCVYQNAYGTKLLAVNISDTDREHVARFLSDLGASHPIRRREQGNGYTNGPACRVDITSARLFDALGQHGVTPRKTFTVSWPGFLPPELQRHYLRGYSDGDGWFYVGKGGYVRKSDGGRAPKLCWGIVGTRATCEGAQRLLESTGMTSRTTPLPAKKDSRIFALYHHSSKQAAHVYRVLYEGATVWLPRKRDVAAPYVG